MQMFSSWFLFANYEAQPSVVTCHNYPTQPRETFLDLRKSSRAKCYFP